MAFGVDYEDYAEADVLVFARQSQPTAISEILRWQRLGKKIVLDFDDNFFQLTPDNPAYKAYPRIALERMALLATEADLITVSTEPLADSYRHLNKNVVVLPNCLDEEVFQKERKPTDRTVIGWQGGITHREDLRLVKSPINNLMRRFDFDFVLAGYNPRDFFRRFEFREWVMFSDDLNYYSSFADFSIGICPLRRTPFNECKSDIKFLEYSALGIPTVASSVASYRTIKHGKTGYRARNATDWEKFLSELIEQPERRRELGESAREYARTRTIQSNIWRWEEVYAGL